MVKVGNVVFFSEKNLIQISRGLKQFFVSFTKEGRLVVQMKGYDRYFFCPDTWQVFSRKSATEFTLVTPRFEGKHLYYRLYRGGIQDRVQGWQILHDNKDGIAAFTDKRSKPHMYFTTTSPRS